MTHSILSWKKLTAFGTQAPGPTNVMLKIARAPAVPCRSSKSSKRRSTRTLVKSRRNDRYRRSRDGSVGFIFVAGARCPLENCAEIAVQRCGHIAAFSIDDQIACRSCDREIVSSSTRTLSLGPLWLLPQTGASIVPRAPCPMSQDQQVAF